LVVLLNFIRARLKLLRLLLLAPAAMRPLRRALLLLLLLLPSLCRLLLAPAACATGVLLWNTIRIALAVLTDQKQKGSCQHTGISTLNLPQ
jgi:hypothetical protein